MVLQAKKGSRQLLHAAARVRRMVASYARGLVLDVLAKPSDLVSSALRSPSVALYAAKVIRQMGGDIDLCRIGAFALKPEGAHLGWFPLDGRRLPNLSNDLPDPFVHFAPLQRSEDSLKWYLEICGAVGTVASSSRATKDEFDQAVQRACQAQLGKWARGKAFGRAVLACIVSRVLLNRQVAVAEGLEVLRDWVSENLDTEKAARHRNRSMLANRMFSGLLPHLQEVTEEADSTNVNPRKFRKFLEQLAHHLALLVLGAGTQSAGWLEHVLTNPGEAQRSYWPTMPDSEEAAVVGAMGYVGWYTCPNGHPYSVGECTRPMQKGICPAPGCGAPIGGEHHQNVQGVRTINEDRLLRHRSQPGYIAATSELVDQTVVNQFKRQLNMRGLKAMRLVLRVALWASLSSELPRPAVDAVLPGAAASTKDAAKELYQLICEDWKALLSRTKLPPRELGAWLHVTLMSCPNVGRVLSDETARADFEYNFQVASEHSFTACAQQQEDRKKMDVGTDYTAAACMALGEKAWRELGDNWEKSLYETVETALPCILWHGRQPAGLADFERSFMSCNENADSRPVLSVMLKEQRRLTALKALPALLAWHAVLFEAFEDYGLLREEARQLTNSEAIARLPEHQRAHAEESLNEFCRCFNLAFPLVERLFECEANPFLQQGKVNLPGPMTPETPVIFSLPYVAPSGETEASTLCTVQLANVLQTAQNDLVEAVEAALGIQAENTPALSVSAATEPKVVASLLASLDLRADLLPLLHQSRKETESCNASVAYDLDQLEEALTQHFRGAVRIQVQLRHYRFGGELKDSGRLAILRQRLPQQPLPFGMVEELRRELERRGDADEATELLRALVEDVINLCLSLGALGKAGRATVHAETPLAELVDASADGAKLPQALHSRARLCHLQDLYMELVASNHAGDSLAAVALAYQEPLEPAAASVLAASATELAEWRPVLHDLLAEQLIVDRWPAGSSLKEFLEFAAGEPPPDCFPESLELRHALAVYRSLAAALAS